MCVGCLICTQTEMYCFREIYTVSFLAKHKPSSVTVRIFLEASHREVARCDTIVPVAYREKKQNLCSPTIFGNLRYSSRRCWVDG